MRFPQSFSAAILIGMAIVGQPALAQQADTVVATVNGDEITLGHMIALQQRLPEQYRQYPDNVLYDGIMEQLIQQLLLSQKVDAANDAVTKLRVENEIRAFKAGQLLDEVSTSAITEEKIQAIYDEQYAGQDGGVEWQASHILVGSENEAKALVVALNDGADFAELAKEKSTGPSGPRGGELGWFGPGMMVPEFENALTDMAVNDISAPVKTQFGWHVIKLNDTRETPAPTLDEVREEISNTIQTIAVDAAIDAAQDGAVIVMNKDEFDPAIIRATDLLLQK